MYKSNEKGKGKKSNSDSESETSKEKAPAARGARSTDEELSDHKSSRRNKSQPKKPKK